MSETYQVLENFKISRRLGDASATFDVTLATPLAPTEYRTGNTFEFVIFDNTLSESYTKIRGIIENVKRNEKDNNRIYGMNGQGSGRLFAKQPFNLDCELADGNDYTMEEILELIFADTDVEIGRGQTVLGEL